MQKYLQKRHYIKICSNHSYSVYYSEFLNKFYKINFDTDLEKFVFTKIDI